MQTIELDGHSLVTPESIAEEVFETADASHEGFDDRLRTAKDRLQPHLDGAAEAFRNGAPAKGQAVSGSVRDLLARKLDLGTFDPPPASTTI